MGNAIPTTKKSVRQTFLILSAVVLLVMTVVLIVWGARAGANSAPERLLSQPAAASDLPPDGIAVEAGVDKGSTRLVGTDSRELRYFIGTQGDNTCLLIVNTTDDWGSTCGQPGAFSLAFSGVTAWLGADVYQEHISTESIREVVFISPVQQE